jgi:hypothetical protein
VPKRDKIKPDFPTNEWISTEGTKSTDKELSEKEKRK